MPESIVHRDLLSPALLVPVGERVRLPTRAVGIEDSRVGKILRSHRGLVTILRVDVAPAIETPRRGKLLIT